MGFRGRAAILVMADVSDETAHDEWHSHEHLPERLSVPGFNRARRFVTDQANWRRYLTIYEVRDIAVTISPSYLQRLNNPSDWTKRIMQIAASASRTLCDVVESFGKGTGGFLSAVFINEVEDLAQLSHALQPTLHRLNDRADLIGCHFLARSAATVRPATQEEELRRESDSQVDAAIFVESYRPELAARALDEILADSEVSGILTNRAVIANYFLVQTLESNDLASTKQSNS